MNKQPGIQKKTPYPLRRKFFQYILTIILFGIIQQTQGQSCFQTGYNLAFPTGYDNLNFIIDRYNASRTSVIVPMEKINDFSGFTASYGWFSGEFFIGVGYSGAGIKTYAEVPDNFNIIRRRILKVNSGMVDVDLGYGLNSSSSLIILPGISFSMGSFSVKTKFAVPEKIKEESWEKINDVNTMIFGTGFFVRIAFRKGLFVQPYMMFSPGILFENDVTSVNRKINPMTFQNDPNPLKIKNTIFGIKIGLGIYGDKS